MPLQRIAFERNEGAAGAPGVALAMRSVDMMLGFKQVFEVRKGHKANWETETERSVTA